MKGRRFLTSSLRSAASSFFFTLEKYIEEGAVHCRPPLVYLSRLKTLTTFPSKAKTRAMSSRAEHEQEKEQLSGSEEDEDFLDEDIKALRRACLLTGTNPDDIYGNNLFTSSAAAPTYGDYSAAADDTDSDDDLELVRNIKNRFSVPSDLHESLSLNPLASLPPAASDEDDDFETLLAIQRRFSVYDSGKCNQYLCIGLYVRMHALMYLFMHFVVDSKLKMLNELSSGIQLHIVDDILLWFCLLGMHQVLCLVDLIFLCFGLLKVAEPTQGGMLFCLI